MDALHYWMLNSPRYRWIMVTPSAVSADERIKRLHRHHLSLVSERTSAPLCGQYHAGDYHPWPMETRALATEDACVECVRALRRQEPNALTPINQILVVQGTIKEYPPQPHMPPHLLEGLQALAHTIQQQQQALLLHNHATQQMAEQFLTTLQQLGISPPETMLPAPAAPALVPSSSVLPAVTIMPDFVALLFYEQYHLWVTQHRSDGFIIAPHTKGTRLIVHSVRCPYVTEQEEYSYSMRIGTTTPRVIPQAVGREPAYCGVCLSGQPPA